ncbi:hypothetical protein DERP_014314 [Dermatophagoides pteronyssinus]|uniref:Uncharacterized protein n=1 Tax=Dermatophagoides pteronyssinus TaxID=6956 RepID=A0ABQ8JWS0_DERPT|nr:hypothetical protein DERP_014314 [Dermatophagoides pteronyssinus]
MNNHKWTDLEENRGQIPWRHRNGHANDQHEVPFDGLFDENNNRVEMPETRDSANDFLKKKLLTNIKARNSLKIDVQQNETQKLCTSTLYKQFT